MVCALTLLVSSVSVQAEEGRFYSQKIHQNWISGILKVNNQKYYRIFTATGPTAFTLNFNTDYTYIPQVIETKNDSDKGSVAFSEPVDVACHLRVDTRHTYNTSCRMYDDNSAYFVDVGNGLDDDFISDAKSGSTLRIKIDTDTFGIEPIYISFNLSGFSSALTRINSLIEQSCDRRDSDYFQDSTKKKRNSDARYFDNPNFL